MLYRWIILTILVIPFTVLGLDLLVGFDQLPLSKKIKKMIEKEYVYVHSVVDDKEIQKKSIQSLAFIVSGLHTKTCRFALRKLSLYENYSQYMNFISKSSYNQKTKRVRFHLSSSVLPKDMILDFKLDRIKKIGRYNFSFDRGFLKGLKGEIHITEHQKRCLFFTRANWSGPDTGYPNIVFEFFTSTLGKLVMENLFRISKTY